MNILIDMPVEASAIERLRSIPDLRINVIEAEERVRPVAFDVIGDTEILFGTYPPENFSDMRALQFIQIPTSGHNQLHHLDLPAKGIRACNARGSFDVPIAEWNIAMMVNLARYLRQMIRNQDTGTWDRSAVFQREIRGLTVGLWGYGGIGRETARLAKTMGMRVHVLSRGPVGPSGLIYRLEGTGDPEGTLPDRVFVAGRETPEFLGGLDFLILTLPLTKTTRGIVGERELQALPRTAFLLNPSRGPIVDEQALLKALDMGWIAGAALDTHFYYPMPADHPLWRLLNVIMTPHISGSSQSPHFVERAWDIFVQNVRRYVSGEPLLNELTPVQLQGE
jgi:phosphoglycerate dehydrogenase-like enzyme